MFGPVAAGDGPVIEDLERVGWQKDDGLSGNLESVIRMGGLTYFSGWVNNPQDFLNRTSMLLLIGDKSTAAVPRSYRSDIIQFFGLSKAMAPTTFKRAIPDTGCAPGLDVRAVAISRKYKLYKVVNVAKCPA